MTLLTKPTPDEVGRAVALMAQPALYRRFFERLNNPLWLEPLAEHGYFKTPPTPVVDVATGSARHVSWPELDYLRRIVGEQQVAARIAALVSRLPNTTNERVRQQVMQLAMALPQPLRDTLPFALVWAQGPFYFGTEETFAEVVIAASQRGDDDYAFELTRVLLEPQRDPDQASASLRATPRPRFSTYAYNQILEKLTAQLGEKTPERWTALVADIVTQTLGLAKPQDPEDTADYSHIWYPNLDSDKLPDADLLELLVAALRMSLDRHESHESILRHGVQDLMLRPQAIFARLALRAMLRLPLSPLAEELLLRTDLAKNHETAHEYSLLLASQFARLGSEQRKQVIAAFLQGPYPVSDEPSELRRRFRAHWVRDFLALIRPHLNPGAAATLKGLEMSHGPAQPIGPAVGPVESGWIGPRSPLSMEEMQTLSTPDLVAFLSSWIPRADWSGPSATGLGHELTRVVQTNADRFARDATKFVGLQATYVRSVLDGLCTAVRDGATIAWAPTLELGEWVVAQPRSRLDQHQGDWERDPHWGWSRKSLVELLREGVRKRVLSEDAAAATLRVLLIVAEDPDPNSESEAGSASGGMDPVTLSLNTVRSTAIDGLITFALWRKEVEAFPNLDRLPELRNCLNRHMSVEADSSIAVRSVLGQKLPWLHLLDAGWFVDRLALVLPNDPEHAAARDAAWLSYLATCTLYDDVWAVLRSQYEAHVGRLTPTQAERKWFREPEERLGEHLVLALVRGLLDLRPGTLLPNFVSRAPSHVLRHALWFVSTGLRRREDISTEALGRLGQLLDLVAAGAADPATVMQAFGGWAASGKFDPTWVLPRLLAALRATQGQIDFDREVLAYLATLVGTHPNEVLDALELLLSGTEGGWRIHTWMPQVRVVLAAAQRSPQGSARARAFLNWLGRRGATDLGDLAP